jgi:outer membrane protein with beta-barrel domain
LRNLYTEWIRLACRIGRKEDTMRKAAVVAAAALMCAISAIAQGARTQFSVFTSNIGYTQSGQDGSNLSGEVSLALSHAWNPRWSTELAVSAARGRAYAMMFNTGGAAGVVATFERRSFTAYPVDLLAQYRFMSGSRWTPYISGGLRYVARPSDPPNSLAVAIPGSAYAARPNFGFNDRASAEIGLGAALRLTPHFGLRFDGMRLLRTDSAPYDRLMRGSLGVSWRF